MARPSVAALAVVPAVALDRRLPAPADLTEAEAAMWVEVVDSKPADWFAPDSAPVLKEYVRAALMCDELAGQVRRAIAGGQEGVLLKDVMDMRDKESRRMMNLATKLRLTQQSRYTPQRASTVHRQVAGRRPWE